MKSTTKSRNSVKSGTTAPQEESEFPRITGGFRLGRRPWRTKRLDSAQAVRQYLGGLLNRVESGEVLPEYATKCASVAQVLLGAVRAEELGELAERIKGLEARLEASA